MYSAIPCTETKRPAIHRSFADKTYDSTRLFYSAKIWSGYPYYQIDILRTLGYTIGKLINKKHYMKFAHQGDIPFFPFVGQIKGTLTKHTGSVVLALGEKTGHKHVITVANPNDMEAWKQLEGGWIISLKTKAQVTHNQHGAIIIAPGLYRVGQEREYDYFQEVQRKVID